MKNSTKKFIRESYKTNGLLSTIHGLIYLHNPEAYIANLSGRTKFSRFLYTIREKIYSIFKIDTKPKSVHFFSNGYHAKVLAPHEAKTLIKLNRPVNIELSEEVLPYPHARKIVLEENCKIGVLKCPCRATASNPCYPLDVCILMGDFVVDFALEHYPNKFRQINKEEAENILEEAKKRGNVAHAFFKEAVLGRFYAICNCCNCCCAAMSAFSHGLPMLASSGYLAKVDEELCKDCGKCQKICPFKAIYQEEDNIDSQEKDCDYQDRSKVKSYAKVDSALCMGCKICEDSCKFNAISFIAHPKVSKLEF